MDFRRINTLILDLDDTIYPTRSIPISALQPLFGSLRFTDWGYSSTEAEEILEALYIKPMASVSEKYNFPEELTRHYHKQAGKVKLSLEINPFPDYAEVLRLPVDRHLVTTGTTPVQWQKIDALNIREDFKHILIDDPMLRPGGKEKCFKDILELESRRPGEVLVIGDNPSSEIQAAEKLGIPALLIDRSNRYSGTDNRITDFIKLTSLFRQATT